MLLRSLLALAPLIALVGCGAVTSEQPTALASVTRPPIATPAASPTPGTTPSPVVAAALTAVATEVADADYSSALDLLVPLFEAAPHNKGIANTLAALYSQAGEALLRDANGKLVHISDAYFMFTKGLDAQPSDEQLREQLQTQQALSEALVALAEKLARLRMLAPEAATGTEQQTLVSEIHPLLVALAAERPAYVGALPAEQLLLVAAVAEARGDAIMGAEGRTLFIQALDIAALVSEQFPASPAAADAQARLARLQAKKDPPPTPTLRPTAPPVARPTEAPQPPRLRFRADSYHDDPACITVQVSGVGAEGWRFSVDGLRLGGTFDGAGNARTCGLGPQQEVTITLFNPAGQVVPGGGGVPSRGGAIMIAEYR